MYLHRLHERSNDQILGNDLEVGQLILENNIFFYEQKAEVVSSTRTPFLS